MRIRYGYRIELICAHDMPLITLLDVHPSRRHDLTTPDEMRLTSLADPSRPRLSRSGSASAAISRTSLSRSAAA